MRLTYVLDYVFHQTPDGRVWTDTSYDGAFWEPYLAVYRDVTVVSRVRPAAVQAIGWREVSGPHVAVAALPLYQGPLQYLMKSAELGSVLRSALVHSEAVILRMPSNLARCAAAELDRLRKPYAVDVVGDPSEALAPGVVRMPGRPLLRRIFTASQRRICRKAIGVSYVARVLHKRYGCAKGAPALVCSDVRLGREWLRETPRKHDRGIFHRLLTVATLSQTYKGIDVLLRAMALCLERGIVFQLTIVGTGRYREELEQLAESLGLGDQVAFAGAIPWGQQLRSYFDAADIFVLPSRVEVMPRALLEALSRAMPAIATNVGAVAEVLDAADMVPAGDAQALCSSLMISASRPEMLDEMSARNLARAQCFGAAVLQSQWKGFHLELRRLFLQQQMTTEKTSPSPAAA